VSGAELVVGGALLLVVATGVGRSVPVWVSVLVLVPVLPSAPVFVSAPVLLTVPESEWEVSTPSVPVVCGVFVVSVLVLSELVFSGRPVVVVRGLPPLFEDVPEPDVGLPVFVPVPLEAGAPEPVVPVPVPVPVVVVGGTTLLLDPLATGTSGEGTGVEVFEGKPDPVVLVLVLGGTTVVSEVSFCWPVPWGSSVVFVSGWSRVVVGV
jgi:hypothetical protein